MEQKLNNLKLTVAEGMDFPKEIVAGIPSVTVVGQCEVIIENHKGILSFEDEFMKINTKLGVLNIKGENLEIIFIGGNTITVGGKFKGLSYGEDL
ncbi:sporulation protein YqfC [Clostridium tarantellae]|uniref:Sporulation protein YqfC n=1 Tax=Clostridium tarantellae TaxID=39493 RepID=A0A6I1MJC5_9CLOT|nr:sporulation protein YqfC [Clostridium tarantellae]MPQ42242.1 sporulation protein YqfC [Clostridium tarantellae]